MKRLKPEKLHVRFLPGATPEGPVLPRRYTLTHSDMTGHLFLTIGPDYHQAQISGVYTKLMRDEALAEWVKDGEEHVLQIYVHVSGGWVVGTAAWRNKILHKEMPLVIEAVRYAEQFLLSRHPELDSAKVEVHFQSNKKKYNVIESWGLLGDYKRMVRT